MRVTLLQPSRWAAARWAWRAVAAARRLDTGARVDEVVLPDASALDPGARGAVATVLRRRRATCLVESLVWQRWRHDHGEPVDLVIGVQRPSGGFQAHAWIEDPGERTLHHEYTEIARHPRPAT